MAIIFVGNLEFDATDEELMPLFTMHGVVSECQVQYSDITGISKGYAFVDMPDAEEAEEAVRMLSGQEFQGRRLALKFVMSRPHSTRASV